MVVVTVEKDETGEPELLLERSRAITLQGRDRKGRAVVRIVGNYFPARALGGRAEEALRGYLRERMLPAIGGRDFVVVYMHSRVDRGGNFPGVGAIRAAYESLPAGDKGRLRAVYFVHPALQSRLYEKLRYMSRLEYVWAHMDKGQLEVPDCVREHDEELERRPLMDYGIEATESRCMYDAASMDTSASLHSLRYVS
ncbi:hypothetical protein SETIT_1G266800v2 [Setaria italica]|uniref:CRAL-TRIO domain-containing protein n=1 Tax=Setaria italica TaxID=4555 RepID=A0A368PQ10_SETIT|nr:ganglioside-induced differentiation-associated protein 2 isoform X2 [Setaria italica]RCV07703.1 hypothetical protein SETIT_1G266800v2 [Setaria italica]